MVFAFWGDLLFLASLNKSKRPLVGMICYFCLSFVFLRSKSATYDLQNHSSQLPPLPKRGTLAAGALSPAGADHTGGLRARVVEEQL